MFGVYVICMLAWLVTMRKTWRDLLPVQYLIGIVIFVGMLEKAVYFGEYESLNKNGVSGECRSVAIVLQLRASVGSEYLQSLACTHL